MAKILISFGGKPSKGYSQPYNRDWDREVSKLFESAKPYNLHCVKYDPDFVRSTQFYHEHKKELDSPHMGWLFKPFVIREAVRVVSEGDFVLWMDSNMTLIADPQPVFDATERLQVWCRYHPGKTYPNKDWCTIACFKGMDCDSPEYWDEPQTKTDILCFKKTPFSLHVLDEYVRYCADPQNIADTPGYPGFHQSRWEQSVFSLLRQKMNIPAQLHLKIYEERYEPA